jgi:hypothetical protein
LAAGKTGAGEGNLARDLPPHTGSEAKDRGHLSVHCNSSAYHGCNAAKHPVNIGWGNSSQNVYITDARLNNKPYSKNYLTYGDIVNGGEFNLQMSATPNYKRGILDADLPFSVSR